MIAWICIAIVTIIASISDALLGVTALAGLLAPSNLLAWTLCFGGGFVLTGMAMSHQAIFSKNSSIFLKMLWFIALAIDAFTTLIGGVVYVIEKHPFGTEIDPKALAFDSNNSIETVIVFGLTVLLTGCSVATTYVFEKLKD
ncbi:MAG: hypothetical protein F6J95_029055 [Leptolyngbya sp. SIO1E4]|nr:hypothetical protein [Leptolyngbya sp. SIO1E4]